MDHSSTGLSTVADHTFSSLPSATVERPYMIDGSGVFTTEGNVAGDRAGRLTKARDEQRQQFADKRAAIEKEHRKASVAKVDDKFNAASDTVELNFKSSTVGLVNLKDYVALSKKRDADEEAGCVCVCVVWRCWCRGGGLRGVGGGRGVVGGGGGGGGEAGRGGAGGGGVAWWGIKGG